MFHICDGSVNIYFSSSSIGVLTFTRDTGILGDLEAAMVKCDVNYRKLSNSDLMREYPRIKIPSETQAVLETDAGMLYAQRALRGFQVRLKCVRIQINR